MNVQWSDWQLFLTVSEARSFSKAARILKLGQPTVSRRIAQLEEQIGQALFVRGREGAQLTAIGHALLPATARMAEWAAEVDRLVAGHEQTPSGAVRLTAPPGVAFDFLAPAAAEIRRQLPKIRLEVLSSVDYLDLGRGDADLALRNRAPAQRELECLYHEKVVVSAFSTVDYAARLPRPCRLADIDWITWAKPYEHLPPRPQLEARIDNFQPAFASDSFITQLRALELGMGAMWLGRPHAYARSGPGPDQRHRPLVELDIEDYTVPMVNDIYLICAKSAKNVPKIRAVAALLMSTIDEVVTRAEHHYDRRDVST